MVSKVLGSVKAYDWGDPDTIREFARIDAKEDRIAELWFGTHPSGPSQTEDGGSLLDLIHSQTNNSLAPSSSGLQGELPFLVKLLSAERALSIQVHPSSQQALEGFRREEELGIALDSAVRTYQDANHKPELLLALSPFKAMNGFRRLSETMSLLDEIGARTFLDFWRSESVRPKLEAVIPWLLEIECNSSLIESTVDEISSSTPSSSLARFIRRNIIGIANDYPGDPGILVAMFLNHVSLRPGQILKTLPGTVHAYLEGFGVEVMSNSDNVVRGGLTSKYVDREEFSRVADFTESSPCIIGELRNSPVAVDSKTTVSGGFSDSSAPGSSMILNLGEELLVGALPLARGEAAWIGKSEAGVDIDSVDSNFLVISTSL